MFSFAFLIVNLNGDVLSHAAVGPQVSEALYTDIIHNGVKKNSISYIKKC